MTTTEVQARKSISGAFGRSVRAVFVWAFLIVLMTVPLARAHTFTVLHKFTGQASGTQPPAGVIVDTSGNLYGVTEFGGSFNFGAVFQLDAAGKEKVLHSFLGGDGLWPAAPLIWGTNGTLYGTTLDGGTPEGGRCEHGCGTVFAIDTAGKETVLYPFKGGTDGGDPASGLVRDRDGNLYGTTFSGGDLSCYVGGCGVVFKLNKNGSQTVLYRFTDRTDGKMPKGLVRDHVGNLYGTTYDGGTSGHGAVFKLYPTGKLIALYSFTGGSDSAYPSGNLIRDQSGNIYGTTSGVGSQDYGVVFRLDTARKLTVLYSFTGGADGKYPVSLIRDTAGNLYGTTYGGGTGSGCYYGGCGVVFKLDANAKETVLHSFKGTDGQLPNGLIMDGAGNLYGTTLGGGKGSECSSYHGCGTVFKLSP
jgi:uncharacterized repeat protein (TIGR03803 family)